MRMKTPRVHPVPFEEWNDAQKNAVGATESGGRVLNIFKTLANHAGLAKRWMVFANHIMGKSEITDQAVWFYKGEPVGKLGETGDSPVAVERTTVRVGRDT